jgi:hypothetical protein
MWYFFFDATAHVVFEDQTVLLECVDWTCSAK